MQNVQDILSLHTGELDACGADGAYVDLARSTGPYFAKTNGIGVIARAMKPNREDAQRAPSLSYI